MKNQQALEWYVFANRDIQSARTLEKHSHPKPLEIICYLCEQSVEEMLKGFLVSNNKIPPKTHDLPLLCDMCISFDESFKQLYDTCEFLTLYGVQPRYPNELDITLGDAVKALNSADLVFDFYKNNNLWEVDKCTL